MPHGADFCTNCGAPLGGSLRCANCGADASVDPYVGRLLGGRYELRELIGIGGMGRVYRAVHVGLERMVAVKLINPQNLENPSAAARFLVEARAASRLNHPNVIAIHDFGGGSAAEGPELYLVMELLSGPSLGEILRAGPMPLPRVTEVLCQILGALHEAHRQGVTHRDIKPENIILETLRAGVDQVKVIDFGVAKLQAGSHVTVSGEILGTPRYMAPEQARGEQAGPAADIYAVGLLMFEMLTGRQAFEGRNAGEVLAGILSPERPDPRAVAPERAIPALLAAVCSRAIALDPADRHPSAEAFARAIFEAAGRRWAPKHSLLFVSRTSAASPTPPVRPPADSDDEITAPSLQRRSLTPLPASKLTPPPASQSAPLSEPAPLSRPTPSSQSSPVSQPAPFSQPTPSSQQAVTAPSSREHLRATVRIKRIARAPDAPQRDEAGEAIRVLVQAFQAARGEVLAGEMDATTTWAQAGRQLGDALVGAGRVDEAYGVLREILEHTDPRTLEHALVAEQLAHVAELRGRTDEMQALLQKALDVAQSLGNEAVAERLLRAADAHGSGVRPGSRGIQVPILRDTGDGRSR